MRDLSELSSVGPWTSDWAWGIPLIVFTVIFHVYGLALLYRGVAFVLKHNVKTHPGHVLATFIIGVSALYAIILHALEALVWAIAYYMLGALPNRAGSMLYSLGSMTTHGNANLRLHPQWQLMGSLESVDGWILFGLTTAFMFALFQRVWTERKLSI